MTGSSPFRAWPVDFGGFTTFGAVVDRIDFLRPFVNRGHPDLCWAAWETENLVRLLNGEPLIGE
ncbi:hypothetical protein LJR168_003753 [Pseudoxanthomonas sp. LjRoot168]|uniref:hypothetical protein n=1 Tax=unclassified Pseudoxanthomonas TaxID=2645906 RepID=UPI003ED0C0BA